MVTNVMAMSDKELATAITALEEAGVEWPESVQSRLLSRRLGHAIEAAKRGVQSALAKGILQACKPLATGTTPDVQPMDMHQPKISTAPLPWKAGARSSWRCWFHM